MSRAAEDYFSKQIEEYGIKWQEPEYMFPHDEMDRIVDIDSQYSGLIDLRKHTKMYLNNLADFTSEIIGDVTSKEVIKAIKRRKD